MKYERNAALIATALTSGLLLSSCGGANGEGGGDGNGQELTVVSYGGPYQEAQSEAFLQPFGEQNDVAITEDSPSDYAQLRTMVDNERPTWDLVLVANDFGVGNSTEYLEPIDYEVVDADKVLEGGAQEHRLAADIEATVIAYNSERLDQAPETFEDVFDTENFPGPRMFNQLVSGGVLEAALLADGVDAEDLYPLDVERALGKLDTIKDDIIWWETSAQSQQLLESGEAVLGLAWVERAHEAGENSPVEISWNEWLQVDAYWVIPKGAPNAETAQEQLAFLVDEDPQLAFAERSIYGPVNPEVAESPEVQEVENRPTNHLDTRVDVDDEWWGDNSEEVNEEFQQWLQQ